MFATWNKAQIINNSTVRLHVLRTNAELILAAPNQVNNNHVIQLYAVIVCYHKVATWVACLIHCFQKKMIYYALPTYCMEAYK